MKSLLALLITFASINVFSQDCYPFKKGTLCVPQIGQGSQLSLPNPLITKLFNNSANYSGPNCYNTALVVSEVLNSNEVRYVSPQEFEILLKKFFYEVTEPKEGDLVVYEANKQRGHVAYWLGDDLVFHKKSFHKNYLYRITTSEDVGVIEKDEWQPSPMEDFPRWTEVNIGKTTKAYYRRLSVPLSDNFSENDLLWLDILNHINQELIKDGPNWAVGKNMGLVTENFLNTAIGMAKKDQAHPYVIAKLTSLKDQVFQSLEETYYARARGQRQVDRINEEICFHDNEYTQALIIKTAKLLKVPANVLLKNLSQADRIKCKVDIITLEK